MPTLDSTAKAAVSGSSLACAWFIFLDINADPLRVTSFGADVAFSSTGDSDLDGFTFTAFGGSLINVGDVSNSESGSDTLTITLSGIVGIDASLLADIGDKTKWQGRACRLWFRLYDDTGTTPQGAVVSYYTGYMSSVRLTATPEGQTIQLSAENYLAYTTQASNRSYLNQSDYDAADTSATATITAANGIRKGGSGAAGPPPPPMGGGKPIEGGIPGGGIGGINLQ